MAVCLLKPACSPGGESQKRVPDPLPLPKASSDVSAPRTTSNPRVVAANKALDAKRGLVSSAWLQVWACRAVKSMGSKDSAEHPGPGVKHALPVGEGAEVPGYLEGGGFLSHNFPWHPGPWPFGKPS